MTAFLSQEWLDALVVAGGRLPERRGASARLQHVVTGSPDGEVRYHVSIVDGRVEAATLGTTDEAALTCTTTFADARRLALGEVGAHEAFMQGRLKVAGSTGLVMDLLPMLDSDDYRRAVAEVAAMIDA